jgi:diguanylate cyclase (GGDEF)-like protein/PAS domain S-box-containing protein
VTEAPGKAAVRASIETIGRVVKSELDLQKILRFVAEETARLVPYDRFVVTTVKPDGRQVIEFVRGLEVPGHVVGYRFDPPAGGDPRWPPGRPYFLRKTAGPEARAEGVASVGLQSSIMVPVGEPEAPVALMGIHSLSKNAYLVRHVNVLRLIADEIAPAIRNARLYEQAVALAGEARLLAEISRAATAGLDIPSLAARFLEMVRRRVPFDRGVLRMVDAATGGLGAGGAVGVGAGLPLPAFRSRTVTEAVALGRLVVEVDAEPEEPSLEAPLARLGLRSSATLPLISDEHVVGVVTLRRTAPTGFSQDELDFLSRACAQMAPAVDNARLLGEVSTLASTVENSPDFICSADLESRVQYLNAAGRGMVGVANDYDVTQFTWDDFFSEEDAGRVKEVAVPAALSRGSWHGEMRLKTRDGSTIPVEAIVVPVYHRNGALLGVTVSARDIADRKRAEAELNTLATTDTLTGLLNRRQFMLMLDQAVKLATRRRTQGTLVYLDLDGFKYVNDTHGHTAGDELLVAVGKTLKANVRASDVVARTGGDEFVIILHDASPEDGLNKAGQLVGAVADTVIMVGSEKVNTTCSAGIVAFPIADASADDLVAFADLAMYRAKDAGRNRTHSYDPSEGGRELVSGLQRSRRLILDALAADRVRLYRQPIFNVVSREIAMYEVLVRMADVDGRLLSPAEFIPQAETLDVVHLIDQRVVDLSLVRWRSYEDAGVRLRLSINLSGRSLGADMAGYIIESGRRHRVEPADIAFEITETATWRGGAQTEEFARLLNEAGYRMSIDDFGSGATSFKQIRNLQFHYLKLDGSLVENLKEGRHDRDLVRSLSGLAHTLGVEIVAEYVRDEDTMRFLQACGIEYAQGYYLGRPEEFEDRPHAG